MKRNCSLQEISDGKLYGINDMVKADCLDCKGCSACCRNMGKSIILDPLDIHRLSLGLQKSFQQMLECGMIELNVVDGVILPNLKMDGSEQKCVFLSGEERCSIHSFRPGICRMFPLGRYYENGGYQYFLQVHECRNKNRAKVKVSKWLDTPEVKRYETYINQWHYFLVDAEEKMQISGSDDVNKQVNLYILNHFFVTAYQEKSFYDEFEQRLSQAYDQLHIDMKYIKN